MGLWEKRVIREIKKEKGRGEQDENVEWEGVKSAIRKLKQLERDTETWKYGREEMKR